MDKNRAFLLLVFIFLVLAFVKIGLKLIVWIILFAILASIIYNLWNR